MKSKKSVVSRKHSPFVERFFAWYFLRRMKKRFRYCKIKGEENVRRILDNSSRPIILVATHQSWWDLAIAVSISISRWKIRGIGLMDKVQLDKHPYFKKLGMISIDRSNVRSSIAGLRESAEELNTGRARIAWVFPQGKIEHPESPVKSYERGVERLISMVPNCLVVPVSFRFELVWDELPTCRIVFGEILDASTSEETLKLCLSNLAGTLREDEIVKNEQDYLIWFAGRKSINEKWA